MSKSKGGRPKISERIWARVDLQTYAKLMREENPPQKVRQIIEAHFKQKKQ